MCCGPDSFVRLQKELLFETRDDGWFGTVVETKSVKRWRGGGGVFPKRKHYRIGTYLFEQGEVMERKTAFVVLEGHAKVQIIEKVRRCKISAVEC